MLLVFGFAVKVGVVPVQVWLPRGYAAAPASARAVMAGVAVNAGFYGLWRTFALLGSPPGWLTGILLVLAALTAVIGIAHAAVQTSLPRVIAYSSVENTGLIVTGFGVALTGAAVHDQRLVAAGLLAATLQVIAHTLAKSLLFSCGATVEAAAGTDDLDGLRGAARRTPWSGTGFAIGALTLAGLPLTAGFVSEWFLLEVPDAAVPGPRAGLPPGARGGRRRGRAHRRLRRGDVRAADRPGRSRPRPGTGAAARRRAASTAGSAAPGRPPWRSPALGRRR